MQTIELEMIYGNVECKVYGKFTIEETQYIALAPNSIKDEFWLFKLIEKNSILEIYTITEQQEFRMVSQYFEELYKERKNIRPYI